MFSAFKTHRQGNDLRSQLFDSEGRVRSFAQFRKASEPILGDYNVQWLQTEYNTTLVRATHTAHWLEMEREKDLYPNLEWMASTAAHPREAHKAFYGLILPMGDAFWTTNYPGNVWGCLCGIRSTSAEPTGRTVRRSALRDAPKPAPGLDLNPVQSEAIYSFSHPYFIAGYLAYKKLKPIAERFARKVMFKYTDSKVQKAKQIIDKYRGRDVLSENLHTGSVKFLRRTYKDVKTHNADHRVLLHLCDPGKAVKRWKYIGRKEVGLYPEGHKLAGQRKHPEAEYFAYYEVKIGGRVRYVHTKFSRKFQTEIPYVITDNINLKGIKKEEP